MEYTTLWDMTSELLLLSHGQASVERGISVNKQMERTNMCHETFISERLVNDRIRWRRHGHRNDKRLDDIMSCFPLKIHSLLGRGS